KFSQTYDFKFDFIIGDLHPHFLHTKYFEKQGFKLYKAQHHWAHLLSVMIENDISSEVLGVAFDGTGYGDDGEIWGGELFLCDQKGYKRILHFDEFELIGGDKAIKNIYYLAYAILRKYDIDAPEFKSRFDEKTLLNLDKVLSRNINLVKTSSLGRIFDAFACLALKIDTVSYDAQAAMSLEALYDENLDISYKFEIENDVITYKDVFLNALSGSPRVLATGFINGLADLILNVALMYKKPLVLSGGVFQNRALLTKTISNLKQAGITFYLPKDEPANDSGLAMGQIYYGLNFLGYNSNK
ncbi:MAG: carbamoyltransferase HypF, partial [Campylobacter hyointestinalis]